MPSEHRSSNTLRGSGWLREAPTNLVPAEWLKIRGRAALRQCIFLPGPDGAVLADYERERERRGLTDVLGASALPRRAKKAYEPTPGARRQDPMRQARIFPAIVDLSDRPAAVERDRARAARGDVAVAIAPLSPSPLVTGILLFLAPPVGLALLWSSPTYHRDARWALTFSSMFCMALVTALVIALAR